MIDIILQNLGKSFGATRAVDEVSLHIPAGSLFFLLGPSGCGKTTLLRMVAGFVMPDSGAILFDQTDMTNVPPHRRDTGMVFQSYALWPHMTVGENVAFGLDVRKMAGKEKAERVQWALSLVKMEQLAGRKPNALSGGQQQRVALARALAIKPRCLLLDEPLSNLDAKLRLEMRSEIKKIVKAAEITAVYVTHDQKEALSMADGIAVMHAGKLEQVGMAEELYRRPASRFVAEFIGESNFLTGTVEVVGASTVTVRTAAGLLQASVSKLNKAISVNQKVLAAFRPEAVRLQPQPTNRAMRNEEEGAINELQARPISMTYLGDTAEYLLELAGGEQVKALEMNPGSASMLVDRQHAAITIRAADVTLVDERP